MVSRSHRLLVAALVLALSGCAHPTVAADAGGDSTAMSPSCRWPSGEPAPSKQPLPEDFVPVTARRCVLTAVAVPDDGEWQVRDEQEAAGQEAGADLDRLVAVLRQPSAPKGDGPCPAIGVVPIDLTLVDAAGRTVDPTLPHDACGLPVSGAVEAVNALPWKSVKQTKVGRLRSQLELDSGCAGGFKPVVDLAATSTDRSGAPAFGGTAPSTLTVCRFRLDPSDPISLDRGPSLASGVLDSAGTLTGADLTRLVAAIETAPPVTVRCDKPQQPFAVLLPPGGSGRFLAVELGGCYRLLDAADQLRQLDAATVAPLKR